VLGCRYAVKTDEPRRWTFNKRRGTIRESWMAKILHREAKGRLCADGNEDKLPTSLRREILPT
jgi:hypothetical protein